MRQSRLTTLKEEEVLDTGSVMRNRENQAPPVISPQARPRPRASPPHLVKWRRVGAFDKHRRVIPSTPRTQVNTGGEIRSSILRPLLSLSRSVNALISTKSIASRSFKPADT